MIIFPFKRHLFILSCSCLLSIVLIEFRVAYFKNIYNQYLKWNLFLAIIPLIISYVSFMYFYVRKRKLDIILIFLFLVWLLFFPNAPYIISDLVHLKPKKGIPIWFDICMFFSFAWNGIIAGIISMRIFQIIIEERFNKITGWFFVLSTIPLSAFGIYLGRFLRWNSWDLFKDPLFYFNQSIEILISIGKNIELLGFLTFISIGILLAYILVISFAYLNFKFEKEK